MLYAFQKITSVNGFDEEDTVNAKQNNYAWSMEELDDYLYVGTARNVVYGVLVSGMFGDVEIPPELDVPKDKVDFNGEIWRYKKDGTGCWERVYKPEGKDLQLGIMGFRFMINYKNAIYAGALSLNNKVVILKSSTGEKGSWKVLSSEAIQHGDSTRVMAIHEGKLYLAVMGSVGESQVPYLYESKDPENEGWTQIVFEDSNNSPNGEIISMISFNNKLYIGMGLAGGFEVWRTNGPDPKIGGWKLVVDKGAGDALNELAMSMEIFRDNIYIGSGIWLGFVSEDSNVGTVPPKGIDIIKLDKNDKWKVVVGGQPVIPTEPITGKRNKAKYDSGFGYLSNAYCWQIKKYCGELCVGTWDWSILMPSFLRTLVMSKADVSEQSSEDLIEQLKLRDLLGPINNLMNSDMSRSELKLESLLGSTEGFDQLPIQDSTSLPLSYFISIAKWLMSLPKSFGFDMWKSSNGTDWKPITITGLGHPHNYGLRNIFPAKDGNLYLGTANPFDGCEVWVARGDYRALK